MPLYNVISGVLPLYNVTSGVLPLYNVTSGVLPLYNVTSGVLPLYNVTSAVLPLYNVTMECFHYRNFCPSHRGPILYLFIHFHTAGIVSVSITKRAVLMLFILRKAGDCYVQFYNVGAYVGFVTETECVYCAVRTVLERAYVRCSKSGLGPRRLSRRRFSNV
jgi:hypothetical protein